MSEHVFGSKQVLNQSITNVPDKLAIASKLTHSKQEHEKDVCPICKMYIKNQSNLSLHLKRVHNCQHTCSKCKKEFSNMEFLNEHLKTHYKQKTEKKQKTNPQFKKSQQKAISNTTIYNYLQPGANKDYLCCKICKMEFLNERKTLARHFKANHSYLPYTKYQDINEKIKKTSSAAHYKQKTKKKRKTNSQFKCSMCKSKFKSMELLNAHLKKEHQQQRTEIKQNSLFICSICKIEFTCLRFLNIHLQTHKPQKTKEISSAAQPRDQLPPPLNRSKYLS